MKHVPNEKKKKSTETVNLSHGAILKLSSHFQDEHVNNNTQHNERNSLKV